MPPHTCSDDNTVHIQSLLIYFLLSEKELIRLEHGKKQRALGRKDGEQRPQEQCPRVSKLGALTILQMSLAYMCMHRG